MNEPITQMTGTKTFLGRWGPAIVFAAGWYVLPSGRARNLYLATFAAAIGGVFTTDLGGWETTTNTDGWGGGQSTSHLLTEGWKSFIGVPSVWSWILWAVAAVCAVLLVSEVRTIKRQLRSQPQAPTPVAPLPETFVEDMNVPEPPFTAQVVVTPSPEPPATSKLWIPEPQRRVRRGGTTLSGVPIKDRRAVDPRNL